MSEQPSFFEGFYVHYLLHDVYGKIIPGSLVLISFSVSENPTISELSKLLSANYSVGWFFIVGISWIIGFSLQVFTNHWTVDHRSPEVRYGNRIKFFRCASQFERHQHQRYTLVVDATGNGARAFWVSALVFVLSNITSIDKLKQFGPTILTFILIGGALYILSKKYTRKDQNYMLAVLKLTATKHDHADEN